MLFESRKLYAHGQNDKVFLLQIPKHICTDMDLTKDTLVDIEYKEGQIIIKKSETAISPNSHIHSK